MRKFRAPQGDGFYLIGIINGKHVAEIYDSIYDEEPAVMVENDYNELCGRLANYYF